MKLKGKALLSLLIVLTLLVQLFTVGASATYGEALSCLVETTDGSDGSGCSVIAGGSMVELMSSGLSVTPPAGYCVQRAWIEGGDGSNGTPLPLSADEYGGTSVSMSGAAFVDHSSYDGSFDDALLSSAGGAYTLHVLIAPQDGSPVEVRDANGSDIAGPDGSFTVPGDPGYGEGFVGWRLEYDASVSSVLLRPGTVFTPYASGSLEAVYATVVYLQPQSMTVTAGESIGYIALDESAVPYGMRVEGWSAYSEAGDPPMSEGSYSLIASGGYLVYNDGSSVPDDVAQVRFGSAVLTVNAAPVPVHEHSWGEPTQENYIAPSCSAPGSYDSVVRCTGCGEELSRETVTVPATDHVPGEAVQENYIAPSCSAPGSYDSVVRCVNCGAEFSREAVTIPALDHVPGEAAQENYIAPSCSAPGSYDSVVRCVNCGAELSRETVTVPATGEHTGGEPAQENYVAPSCSAPGSYESVVRCTGCGAELSRETVTIPAADHVPGEAVQENYIAPSCTEPGSYESVVRCTSCGAELSRETVSIPATDHDWGDWVVTKPATEAEEGVETRTCKNDPSHTETRPIEKLSHVHTLVKTDEVPASCEADGTAAYWTCSGCGRLFADENASTEIGAPAVIPATGHDWGDWVVTKPATETEEGIETRTCKNDPSHTETRPIEKLSHVHVMTKVEAVPATCEQPGSIEYYRCESCGKLFRDEAGTQELTAEELAVPATGHNWSDWVVTKEPTETEDGVETRTCGNDPSHVETRSVPAKGHTHSMTKVEAVPATCEQPGSIEYYRCESCGRIFRDEAGTQELSAEELAVPATGHDWGEWTVTKEPTETEPGIETRTCKNDPSHTETREIDPSGHTHSLIKVDAVAATCEQDGNIAYYKCEGCGKLFKDSAATKELKPKKVVVPATGHDWGDWVVTKPATETKNGIETRTCKNDPSHTETRKIPPTGHVHKANKVLRKEPGYGVAGNIEYYSCSGCGKLFKDEACTQEIMLADTVIPMLEPLEVTVTVSDQSWVVGSGATLNQSLYSVTGFEANDRFSVTLSAPGYSGGAGEYPITAELSGYDTSKYHVTVVPGKLKVASPVVYPLTDSAQGYKWSQGSSNGLTLTVNADIRKFVAVKVDGSVVPEGNYIVSSGSTIVTLKAAYLNTLAARDHAISIEFTDGSAATTFVVSPAPVVTPTTLTITGRNVSKAYDGVPYNLSSYGQNTQGITTQFHLAQNGQAVAQAVNPGTYDIYLDSLTFANAGANGYNITIIDSSGQVVATNYSNTSVRLGSLTITGSNVTNVTVTVNDQSWTYDGTAHTPNAAGYTVSGLQGNDTITVKLSVVDSNGRTLSAVTDAGTYSIKADCTGYDASRYNVTVAKSGTLTVTPYRLTLTAESAVKNYDGSPLRNSNVKATALLSGHKFRANDGVKFSVYDSQGNLIQNGPVAVGTYTKKVTDVHIVDANGIEVTSNYNITRIDGTLTINNSDGSPKTGDRNNLTLWIVLLAVSALLILAVATLFLRRGKKKGKAAPQKADSRPAEKK